MLPVMELSELLLGNSLSQALGEGVADPGSGGGVADPGYFDTRSVAAEPLAQGTLSSAVLSTCTNG